MYSALTFELTASTAFRRGQLIIRSSTPSPSKVIATPGCFLYTQRGAVPHLTADHVSQTVTQPAYHVSLQHFMERAPSIMEQCPNGLHEFCGIPKSQLVLCDLIEPTTLVASPLRGKKYVPVATTSGVRQIDVDEYARISFNSHPDIVVSLADIVTETSCSVTRVKRSVKRSLEFLQSLMAKNLEKTPIFASLQGSNDEEERLHCARVMSQQNVQGFVISALGLESLPLDKRLSLLKLSSDALPVEKPRLVYGLGHPVATLLAIKFGLVDLCVGTYPYTMTQRRLALQLSLNPPIFEQMRVEEKSYVRDFETLFDRCRCHTCSEGYSRSYLLHLYEVKEMLGDVLLHMHNVWQYEQFFEHIRASIDCGTFENDSRRFLDLFGGDEKKTYVE